MRTRCRLIFLVQSLDLIFCSCGTCPLNVVVRSCVCVASTSAILRWQHIHLSSAMLLSSTAADSCARHGVAAVVERRAGTTNGQAQKPTRSRFERDGRLCECARGDGRATGIRITERKASRQPPGCFWTHVVLWRIAWILGIRELDSGLLACVVTKIRFLWEFGFAGYKTDIVADYHTKTKARIGTDTEYCKTDTLVR